MTLPRDVLNILLRFLREGICTTDINMRFADSLCWHGTGYYIAGEIVLLLCKVPVESLGTTGTLCTHVGSHEWQTYSNRAGVLNSAGTYTGDTM